MAAYGRGDDIDAVSAPASGAIEPPAADIKEPEADSSSPEEAPQPAEAEGAPLDVVSWADVIRDLPKRPPELIAGVLRRGHVMELTGASKSGKSWLAIELACAVASGGRWLGMSCKQGRVLYLNFEIDPASFYDRVKRVWPLATQGDEEQSDLANLRVANLRGSRRLAGSLDGLAGAVADTIGTEAARAGAKPGGFYSLVIFDPFYMCFNGDENSAGDVKEALRNFTALAEATGAAVLYVHHHAKGAAGGRDSIDRGAGSGVHGRLPDAIVDLTALAVDEAVKDELRIEFPGADAVPLRASFTLREFRQHEPVNNVFSYPVHYLASPELHLERYEERGADPLNEGRKRKAGKEWLARNKAIAEALDAIDGEPTVSAVFEHVALNESVSVSSKRTFRAWLDEPRCEYKSAGAGNRWLVMKRE